MKYIKETKDVAKVTFNVTQEDIDTGRYMNPNHCPVAKAIKRKYPNGNVTVILTEASVYIPQPIKFKLFRVGKAKFIRINLPKKVKAFITNFDSYGSSDLKPFSFEAEVLEIKA